MEEHSLDALDVRILGELLEDGRTPYRRIGGSVGLTTNAVKSRVKKMLADGVIQRFSATVSVAAFGFPRTYYVAVKDTLNLEATFRRLGLLGQVATRIECVGGVTIFEVAVREEQSEEALLSLREALQPAMVQSVSVGHPFPVKRKLTATDYRIMRHLLPDPRMKVSDLAEAVGVSAKTAGERVWRMKEDRLLQFSIDVDPLRMKGYVRCVMMIRLDGKEGPRAVDEIRSEMQDSFPVSSPFFYEKSVIKCILLARSIFDIDPFLKKVEAREHVLGAEAFLPTRRESDLRWILREIDRRIDTPGTGQSLVVPVRG